MAQAPTSTEVATYCPLCVSRCGARATVTDGTFTLSRDPAHPTGKVLCVKGKEAPAITAHPDCCRPRPRWLRDRPRPDEEVDLEAIWFVHAQLVRHSRRDRLLITLAEPDAHVWGHLDRKLDGTLEHAQHAPRAVGHEVRALQSRRQRGSVEGTRCSHDLEIRG